MSSNMKTQNRQIQWKESKNQHFQGRHPKREQRMCLLQYKCASAPEPALRDQSRGSRWHQLLTQGTEMSLSFFAVSKLKKKLKIFMPSCFILPSSPNKHSIFRNKLASIKLTQGETRPYSGIKKFLIQTWFRYTSFNFPKMKTKPNILSF